MFTRDPLLPQLLLEIGLRVVPALIFVSLFVNPFGGKKKDRAVEEVLHRQKQTSEIDKQQKVQRKFKSVKAEFGPVKADMVRQVEMEMRRKGISNSRVILDKRREVR